MFASVTLHNWDVVIETQHQLTSFTLRLDWTGWRGGFALCSGTELGSLFTVAKHKHRLLLSTFPTIQGSVFSNRWLLPALPGRPRKAIMR